MRGGTPRPAFDAVTLTYAARTGHLQWHAFPDDPYLPGASRSPGPDSCDGLDVGGAAEVLRYVPLRRLTARVPARQDGGRSIVAKFKRRSRWREAYDRLASVARSVTRAGAGFTVAVPRGFDESRGLYYQSLLSGENLADRLDEANADGLLRRVGIVHRELHELIVPDAPTWNLVDYLAGVLWDTRWVAFCRPDCGELMREAHELLERLVPTDPGPEAFCHGDFVCSQLLVGDDGWAVTDFDLGHRGDPYRDIAVLLTSLSYDVPLFQASRSVPERLEAAGEAYLCGYQERADRKLDRDRLLWYRLAAEVSYLALALKKDWFQPVAFARGLARLREMSERLRTHEGCTR